MMAVQMPTPITEPNVLVVEGDEDKVFFEALIKHLKLQNIQIMPIGGKEKLRQNLKALTLSPRFSEVISLGVVRDANANPSAAFQSVCDALRTVGLSVPKQTLVPVGHSPRVAIMILPGADTPGTLEDLCLRAIEQNPAMLCVEQYFQCLQQQGLPLPRQMSKAKVHVFLASNPDPDKRLGEAAQAGYWPWDAGAFDQVKSFLQQLARKENTT